jgi:translocation and assembly module TamB
VNVLKRLRRHRLVRYARFGVSAAAATLAAAVVATLTVNLGPAVREYAEQQASSQIERPIHIGRLSIQILTGHVVLEDFTIEGLHPGDRPFFSAGRLSVALDWHGLFRRHPDFTISTVELTDWRMVVEKWDGAQSFPKLTRGDARQAQGPRSFTTTLRYLRAWRGEFVFDDHEIPWSVTCPHLDLNIVNVPRYHGDAVFTGGTVKIQDFAPMAANMKARFVLDGPRVHLDRIDLETDGARSVIRGDVDFANFPEMKFQIQSQVQFPRMREIFFEREAWRLTGDGDFTGTFHLFKGGYDLAGTFHSDVAGINEYRFPALFGSLHWTKSGFSVTDAGSKLFDGDARFTYSLAPLGRKERPTARFEVRYDNVDVAALSDFEQLRSLRFAGRAAGRHLLEWPSGRFADHRGEGAVEVTAPNGVEIMSGAVRRSTDESSQEWGPFTIVPLADHVPITGALLYRYRPEEVTVDAGRFATPRTEVSFRGTTLWGERSNLAFHLTSADWQESDQVLAGIVTDFGSPLEAVAFRGRGEFDGAMTGSFKRPRVEGDFRGEDLYAWDTTWGSGVAHIVFENGYVAVTDGRVRLAGSEIRTDGRFSTSSPRDDGNDELDARFRVTRHNLDRLRHVFQIDDYPVSGQLSGEFHLTGEYRRPIGFGAMTIGEGTAWGEPFENAAASLRFDGTGARMDNVTIAKGTGSIAGAAFVGWDSTYSFNVVGRRIPVGGIKAFSIRQAPPSGLAEFTAGGSGTFDLPRYDVKFHVSDLHVGGEEVGEVTGTLAVRGRELSGEVDAASPRLAVTGTGRVALTPQGDSELTFRFHDSSLDPYVRLFVPKLSPYTSAVASGSIRLVGELADLGHLVVDGTVDSLEMRLFDYGLRNAAPIHLSLNRRAVSVDELQIVGDGTRLRLTGQVGLTDNEIALRASGDANLGILQGFFKNVRSSGRAEIIAAINGAIDRPIFSGSAIVSDGRIRHLSLPASLDAINGTVYFDERGVRLDDLSATMGDGRVQFGGRIGFDGYLPSDLNVTARGTDVRLRYPEGVRSLVDADLAVRGSYRAPILSGTVNVKNAVWTRPLGSPGTLFDFGGRRPSGEAGGAVEGPMPAVPLRFDLQILAPSTLQIDTNQVRMVANADLALRGSYDRPALVGHADIDRGELTFEGRRYRVTRGTIDFTNPTRIEPFFDVAVETNVRVPGQTYRVTVAVAGTTTKMAPSVASDPPLPTPDVLALLFGDARQTAQNAELNALRNPNERQTDIITARATQALTSPISSEVGRVVQQTFGIDTFQLSPSLLDPTSQQSSRLNPTIGVTIAKRISDRAYLTYSRSLNSAQYDQIILLEYDATDRLSWLLSRNEDQTYALEFRVRHAF